MSSFKIPGLVMLTDTSTLQQQYHSNITYSIDKYEERKKKKL